VYKQKKEKNINFKRLMKFMTDWNELSVRIVHAENNHAVTPFNYIFLLNNKINITDLICIMRLTKRFYNLTPALFNLNIFT